MTDDKVSRFLVNSRNVRVNIEHAKHRVQYSTLFAEVTMIARSDNGFPELGLSKFMLSCMTITGILLSVSEEQYMECFDVPSVSTYITTSVGTRLFSAQIPCFSLFHSPTPKPQPFWRFARGVAYRPRSCTAARSLKAQNESISLRMES